MLSVVQYVLPFVINQSGSLLYYFTLSSVGERLCNIVSLFTSLVECCLFGFLQRQLLVYTHVYTNTNGNL